MFVGLPLEANTGGASPRDDSPAQGMAELLQGEGPGVRSIQRGDIIDGMVMKVDRDSILVDIGSKTEGVIPGYEMRSLGSEGLSQVKVGDEILVYVLQPENREGQVVLSLDRATGEGGWRILQQRFDAGEIIEAEVAGYNRGGLLVNIDGVRGFVPISQVMGLRGEVDSEEEQDARFAKWIGTALKLKIIELNRRRNRLIQHQRVRGLCRSGRR
ncbi:MAG: binding domain protein [Dehalococcoidia bacterium]|nr:binding domain protein [Dehalococcoidia bacterium]